MPQTTSADLPPFSEFIRILVRGPNLSRSLTLAEAEAAATLICRGEAEPAQIAALLVLLRSRGETPDELAGLTRALRASGPAVAPEARPDLDWPSYADGRSRGLPWFLLSALLLAGRGIRVLMHGPGQSRNRPTSPETGLAILGIAAATGVADASEQFARSGFAYLPLPLCCPRLQELMDLRRLLGVRTLANTAARMLNPLAAPHTIQGVFHPPYRELQQRAALLLGQEGLAVFKGGGGEAERPTGKSVEVFGLRHGKAFTETWPARETAGPSVEPACLAALWRGEVEDVQAEAIVIGTAAIALRLVGRADTPDAADALAAEWWRSRVRHRF